MIKMRPNRSLYTAARSRQDEPKTTWKSALRTLAEVLRDVSSLSLLIVAATWLWQQLDPAERRAVRVERMQTAQSYLDQLTVDTPPELAADMMRTLVDTFDELRNFGISGSNIFDLVSDEMVLRTTRIENSVLAFETDRFAMIDSTTDDGQLFIARASCVFVTGTRLDGSIYSVLSPRRHRAIADAEVIRLPPTFASEHLDWGRPDFQNCSTNPEIAFHRSIIGRGAVDRVSLEASDATAINFRVSKLNGNLVIAGRPSVFLGTSDFRGATIWLRDFDAADVHASTGALLEAIEDFDTQRIDERVVFYRICTDDETRIFIGPDREPISAEIVANSTDYTTCAYWDYASAQNCEARSLPYFLTMYGQEVARSPEEVPDVVVTQWLPDLFSSMHPSTYGIEPCSPRSEE